MLDEIKSTNINKFNEIVKIGNEIIKYESIGSGFLSTINRGIDSTISIDHDVNSLMYKYELNGVSLRRINKTHDIDDLDIGLDGYYLQIDSINITIPTNVFDSNLLLQLVEVYSKEIEYYTGGIVKLDQMLLDMADGLLSSEVEGILNDILKDYKLLSVDCSTIVI